MKVSKRFFVLTIPYKEQSMTKQELIAAINEKSTSHYSAGVSKVVVAAVLDTLNEVVTDCIANGEEVTIPGIGKLSIKDKAARKGRNPSTGEEMDIPAKRVPHFSAAKALKDAVA
jgi:DNA-binding protein HU-beta